MATIWNPNLGEEAARWASVASDLSAEYFGPAAAEIDANQRYPEEHLPRLLESGIFGMFIPQQYGGGNASLVSLVAVMETISKSCASTSAILAALSLGGFPVLLGGNDSQKSTLLRNLAKKGKAINFALSEPDAGSDAGAIETTATKLPDGKWHIQGEKCWLGNGGHSETFIVFARTGEPGTRNNITAFLIPRSDEGLVVDFYEDKMGIRGTTTTNLKVDARVDPSNILGAEGKGLSLALRTLIIGRIAVAAQAVGIGICAYNEACKFATTRQAFGKKIVDHQGVGFKLADAATRLSSARMVLYEAASAYDAGEDISTLGPMAKLLASEVSHDVCDTAMQVLAGRGYVKPNIVERCYRDQRITEIYEGTSEIQRLVIARAIKKEFELQS